LDFVTGLPVSARGNDAILTVVDRLTKLVVLIETTTDCDSKEFAYLLTKHVISKHGVPEDIVSDRGSIFTGKFWAEVTERLGIHLSMSTAFHPQSDGSTEVMNKLTEQVLRAHVNPRQDDWDEFLSMVEFAINNSKHSSVKHTPFFLNYGRHPLTPVMLETLQKSKAPAATRFTVDMTDALNLAKQNLQAAQDRQKSYVDAKRKEVSFQVGDQVLLATTNLHPRVGVRKLMPKWVGPLTITRAVSEVAYQLELPSHMRIHDVFHVSLLKPYHQNGRATPPMPEVIQDEFEWEVENILLHREVKSGSRSKTEFLIKWVGFGPEHCTWEPEKNLTNCIDLLSLYWKQQAELTDSRAKSFRKRSGLVTPGKGSSNKERRVHS
jgi:hypothetical protein